eukprot:177154_1
MNCYCDVNMFQKYTYYMVMTMLEQQNMHKNQRKITKKCIQIIHEYLINVVGEKQPKKRKHLTLQLQLSLVQKDGIHEIDNIAVLIMEFAKVSMIEMIQTESSNTYKLSEQICSFLPMDLQENNSYIKTYRKNIKKWLLHDFYNVICSHCGSVNKSIMINRVFHFASTLRNCRTCGVIVRARNNGISQEYHSHSQSVQWFCNANQSTFEEEKINSKRIEESLNKCRFDESISEHTEIELLSLLNSLLRERFDQLFYYLSRFLDNINNWKALRLNITANYYFYVVKASYVSVYRLMVDAGIHPSHSTIFKDCWIRALFQSRDNHQLIHILDDQTNNKSDIDHIDRRNNFDVLCTDLERLTIFRKLTSSISAFTTAFIQKLKERFPNTKIDLFGIIKRFLDYKIDQNVFSVINEMEFLSLTSNQWEYLRQPEIVTYWKNDRTDNAIFIEPKYKSLRNEILNQIESVNSTTWETLVSQAKYMWKTKKYLKANRSKWNNIIGIKSGVRISEQHILSVLLFVQISELRHKVNELLLIAPIIQVHKQFAHFFKLLKETIYLYGDVLKATIYTYYTTNDKKLFDKFHNDLNIPFTASKQPIQMSTKVTNKVMMELKNSSALIPIHYFNLSSIIERPGVCLFFGGKFDMKQNNQSTRRLLKAGSECKIYSVSESKWFTGSVVRIFTDADGEWLEINYGDRHKHVNRFSEDLLPIESEKWNGIMWRYCHEKYQSQSQTVKQNDPFLNVLVECKDNILKQCGIECHPKLKFLIKTTLAYYKTSKNIIPDFDTFIQETNIIKLDSTIIDEFRVKYNGKRIRMQNKHIRLTTVHSKSSSLFMIPSDYKHSKHTTNKQYKTYDVGVLIRYDVCNPRFESLAEEIMFNEVINISNERFNQYLVKAKEIYAENCLTMISTAYDSNFGIEKYESINISHIIAVIIHTEERSYSRAFVRSCLNLHKTSSEIEIQNHCNNFYWFGRYIFECIEYFGDVFEVQSSPYIESITQLQPLPRTYNFELFAPPINFPLSATQSMEMALHYAGDKGCVMEFIPKYTSVLNSTKFVHLNAFYQDYDDQKRIFFGKRCAVTIKNIVSSSRFTFHKFILPLVYFEKIVLQTILDRQFWNAKHLYDKKDNKSDIQSTLFNLIHSCIGITLLGRENAQLTTEVDEDTQLIIIKKYFPTSGTQENEILYVLNLLKSWCQKRTFITFESFAAEIPFMIKPLQQFFVTINTQKKFGKNTYDIHITNLQLLMPNLKHYRNFNKQVVCIQPVLPQMEEHAISSTPQGIINIINRNLYHYYKCQFDETYYQNKHGKFKLWCEESKFDDNYVEKQLAKPANYCNLIEFDSQFPLPFDIKKSRQVFIWQTLQNATKPNLFHILYGEVKNLGVLSTPRQVRTPTSPNIDCELTNYPNTNILSPRISISETKDDTDDIDDYGPIFRVLSNCQRHEIPDEICNILKKLKFFKNKKFHTTHISPKDILSNLNKMKISKDSKKGNSFLFPNVKKKEKDIISKFKNRNRNKLMKFYEPICKLHKATRQDFVKIAEEIKLFDEKMIQKLANKLMERLFSDIERMKPWKCQHCWFINRKMMIGGLWCLYNQLNECGLCGEERYKIKSSKKKDIKFQRLNDELYNIEGIENDFELPNELRIKWKSVEPLKCSINESDNNGMNKIYLETWNTKQMIDFVEKWIQQQNDTSLNLHENRISGYFEEEMINGFKFLTIQKKNKKKYNLLHKK